MSVLIHESFSFYPLPFYFQCSMFCEVSLAELSHGHSWWDQQIGSIWFLCNSSSLHLWLATVTSWSKVLSPWLPTVHIEIVNGEMRLTHKSQAVRNKLIQPNGWVKEGDMLFCIPSLNANKWAMASLHLFSGTCYSLGFWPTEAKGKTVSTDTLSIASKLTPQQYWHVLLQYVQHDNYPLSALHGLIM